LIEYNEIPTVYASTKLVIDDSVHGITKPYGSVNSRVFDSLGSGRLVITNGKEGVDSLFDKKVPTYTNKEELSNLVNYYLHNEQERNKLAQQLQSIVLKEHTYKVRANTLMVSLVDLIKHKYRIAIKIPVPNMEVAANWGDYHFGLALARAIRKLGHFVRIDLLPNWYDIPEFTDEVVIVLRGLNRYKPKSSHINLMWNISHPNEITYDEYEEYDHVFVASIPYSIHLKAIVKTSVTSLLQCTDPQLFFPSPNENNIYDEVLFIGNSRKKYRKAVQFAIESDMPIKVCGNNWENIIDPKFLKSDFIENNKLRHYYSNCGVLLNDHWHDMAELGFISNRIFDAAACGACIVTDYVDGIEQIFHDTIPVYSDIDNFKAIISELLKNPKKRSEIGEKLFQQVNLNHTFDKRAGEILNLIKNHPKAKLLNAYEQTF